MPERYREEIEQILEQAGDLPPPQPVRRSRPSIWGLIGLYVRQSLGGRLLSLSPGRIMVAALVILLLALVFGRVGPGIGAPLALAALLLFIVGYAWIFSSRRRSRSGGGSARRRRCRLLAEPAVADTRRSRVGLPPVARRLQSRLDGAVGVADTYQGAASGATVPAPVAFTARRWNRYSVPPVSPVTT